MPKHARLFMVLSLGAIVLGLSGPARAARLAEARIYIEYNESGNDLGFHVSLDGEDWKSLAILDPAGKTIFEVTGRAAYQRLGMTELFFEGAEPSLDEFPLADLLALFPEGRYTFTGLTVGGTRVTSRSTLTHAIPDGPAVSSVISGDTVIIRWDPVTDHPDGFPERSIDIVGYQVLAEPFQVTLPASSREVTLPREFVETLAPGEHPFEVLAIEAGGNQTITEGVFETP